MMMAFYLFVSCVVLQVGLSLAMPKEPGTDLEKLYWPHPLDALKAPGWPGVGNYKAIAGVVFIAMVGLYMIFR